MNANGARVRWMLVAAAVVIGATLWVSPRWLLWPLIVLARPGAMFAMMRGMHQHAGHRGRGPGPAGHQGDHEEARW